jgi:hypothetical protein
MEVIHMILSYMLAYCLGALTVMILWAMNEGDKRR